MSKNKSKNKSKNTAGSSRSTGDRSLLSVMDANGKAPRLNEPGLEKKELLELFRCMLMTRIMEDRALKLQRQGRIGFYLPCVGQEASHIGTAHALRESDWIFPAYRQAGILILRGAPLEQIVDQWYGNEGDISKGRQMPVHYSFRSINFVSISSPIATQLTQATGAAMAAKYRGDDTVFMTYCGDGGTSENDFHSALNFAGVYQSPVVFVVENNQWAISVPLEMQTASETMAGKGEAYGIPGIRVDGNDVLAVYQVAKEAVERARRGEGPTLIETLTFRMGPHSSSDDPTRYREQAEVDAWAAKDPIDRFRKYLKARKHWTQAFEEQINKDATEAISAAIKKAEAKKAPSVSSMFEDVFLEMPRKLEEQRDDLLSLGDLEAKNIGEFPL